MDGLVLARLEQFAPEGIKPTVEAACREQSCCHPLKRGIA